MSSNTAHADLGVWRGDGGRLVRRLIVRHRYGVFKVLLATIGVYVSSLSVPIVTQKIVDGVTNAKPAGVLWALGTVALGLSLLDVLMADRRRAIVIDLGRRIDRHIALILMEHTLAARRDTADPDSGTSLNRAQQADKIKDFLIERVPGAVFDTGGALIAIVIIFTYSAMCGAAVLAVAAVGLGITRAILRDFYANVAYEFQLNGAKQGHLAETLAGLGTIKAMALEPARLLQWARIVKKLAAVGANTEHILRRFFRVTRLSEHVLTLSMLAIGGLQAVSHMLSIGELFAILMLAARVTGPLLNAADIARQYQEATVAVGNLGRLLATPADHAGVSRASVEGPVIFHNVTYRYRDSNSPAIASLSLTLPRSGLVALVGRNGSGKSTLLKLMQGLLRDFEGDIRLNDVDITTIRSRWLRSQMAIVDQDTILFKGTIRDNITGWSKVADHDIEAAMRLSGAYDFVKRLPLGLETQLIENGGNLSGGQRQRLAIARAALRNPKIVLLDEPTAFLDAEAAVQLETKLCAWGRDRLMVLVTHHLAAARLAKTIIALDDGSKVAEGPHDDLLPISPHYRTLWNDYRRGLVSDLSS